VVLGVVDGEPAHRLLWPGTANRRVCWWIGTSTRQNDDTGGGGGGAGAVGGNATRSVSGGPGGAGVYSDITGSAVQREGVVVLVHPI
jgi:hypothetical protein